MLLTPDIGPVGLQTFSPQAPQGRSPTLSRRDWGAPPELEAGVGLGGEVPSASIQSQALWRLWDLCQAFFLSPPPLGSSVLDRLWPGSLIDFSPNPIPCPIGIWDKNSPGIFPARSASYSGIDSDEQSCCGERPRNSDGIADDISRVTRLESCLFYDSMASPSFP